MQFPFKPTAVFHKHGGRILEVTGIAHQVEKPRNGYSQDAWWFVGRVEWSDGSGSPDKLHPIDAPMLCADTPEGHAEINAMGDLMMAYLREHGEWRDAKPRGWYAHRPTKRERDAHAQLAVARSIARGVLDAAR